MLSLEKLAADVIDTGRGLDAAQALEAAVRAAGAPMKLLAAADSVRHHFKGDEVRFCSIVNARSGACGEDCAFCAQSRGSSAQVQTYALRDYEWLVGRARDAAAHGAGEFSIVTSGKKVSAGDLGRIATVVAEVEGLGMEPCASLGVLEAADLKALKKAGLRVFHHNLEAARSFYGNIVSTRSFDDNLATVRAVKDAGLKACCGGIFGLGESVEQRVELLAELAALDVDRVPINFLIPIAGTRLAGRPLLPPLEALSTIALARLMLPTREIVVAGGREKVLGQLQALVFFAGANAILVGNYLTTAGRSVDDDKELVRACGLRVAPARR
jgi:biotin synthase